MMDNVSHLKWILGMWSVYPILVPFYLMGKTPIPGTEKVEGGVPQLADYFLVGVMAVVLAWLPFRLKRPGGLVAAAVFAFVVYTGIVNVLWAANLENLSLVKSTIFYAYDAFLLLTCLVLFANFGEDFLRVTVWAVGVSVVVQAVLSPLAPHQAYDRQALFFNNENQLGYYCLLSATIVVVGASRCSIPLRYQAVFYAALGYLALVSQSRGALLGLGVLGILAVFGRPVRLFLALGAAAAVYVIVTFAPPVLSKASERYVVHGEYDTASARGYDRIVNYPEYILFGAGEGAYERFRSDLYGSELHSSFGTVLFCYGLPGLGLFTLALFGLFRDAPRVALFLIPSFVHGLGHHGLRFAFFWAVVAFLCCCASPLPADTQTVCAAEGLDADAPQPAT